MIEQREFADDRSGVLGVHGPSVALHLYLADEEDVGVVARVALGDECGAGGNAQVLTCAGHDFELFAREAGEQLDRAEMFDVHTLARHLANHSAPDSTPWAWDRRAVPLPHESDRPKGAALYDWPLIGRSDELAHVTDLLGQSSAAGVLFVGPAGVGKTRLATECLRIGEERDFSTARVTASRAASAIPFGALAPLLPPGVIAVERGLNALSQATLALTERAGGRPLMLVVDDAHGLDDASSVLLQQLAASRAAFLVVTLRTGEPAPDSIVSLWKDHDVERITVEPLTRDETHDLLAMILDGDVDQGTLTDLWTKTRGNPLFLRELVLGAVEAGTLVHRNGRWYSTGDLEPTERLSELVESRLGALTQAEAEALELVAFGEPIGINTISELTDPKVVEGLERKGLVGSVRDGGRVEIRLAHPMYGEVLRARTPALRVRSVSRSLAEALETTGSHRRGDALRVALWRLDGGGVPPMPLLLEATAQARFANDNEVAYRLARTAFEVEPSFVAGRMLLDILYASDRPREHEDVCRALEPLAETEADRVTIALARATTAFWKLGDAHDARRILTNVLATVETVAQRDEVAQFLAVMDVQSGLPFDALEKMERARANPSSRPYLLAALSSGLALTIVGRCREALDMFDNALSARLQEGEHLNPEQVGVLLVHKSAALNEVGQIAEAYELADFTRAMAADANDIANQGFCCVALARICLSAGNLAEAADRAGDAVEFFRRWGHPGPMRWSLGYLALAASMMGDRRTAKDAISELELSPPHPAQMLEIDIMRAHAWYAALDGRLEDARASLRLTAAVMRAGGQISFEVAALFDLARLGEPAEVSHRIAELAGSGESALHRTMADGVAAMARGNARELADQAECFERIGALLFAAELAVAAIDAYRRDGETRKVAEWSRRSAELLAQCRGAQTPGLLQIDSPTPLTQREREIAVLAAQGLTSKAIGERLFVASRTVDNHLARIYGKVGVTSRTELAEALTDMP